MTHHDLLVVLAALAGIGLLVSLASVQSASRKASRGLREVTSATGGLIRTMVAAAVITGIEWAIAANVHDWRVLVAVLGVPALLAGRTVARMFAITEFISARGGYRR
jgi:hypothetical protein